MNKLILATFFLMLPCLLLAEDFECKTNIKGEFVNLKYDLNDEELNQNESMRELLFKGWGDIDCPSLITLRHLTPELTRSERTVFCLQYDSESKTYAGFTNGPRDAYLNCKEPSRTFCERVNATKDAAIAITGLGAGAVGGASAAASAAGVSAVAHSSGAVILTGSSGYIAGTLGSIGASSLAVLTAPVTVTTAAVTVVAVGGSVYFCKDKEDEGTLKETESPNHQINRTENTSVQN